MYLCFSIYFSIYLIYIYEVVTVIFAIYGLCLWEKALKKKYAFKLESFRQYETEETKTVIERKINLYSHKRITDFNVHLLNVYLLLTLLVAVCAFILFIGISCTSTNDTLPFFSEGLDQEYTDTSTGDVYLGRSRGIVYVLLVASASLIPVMVLILVCNNNAKCYKCYRPICGCCTRDETTVEQRTVKNNISYTLINRNKLISFLGI